MTSILAIATETLFHTTSGLLTIQDIATKLYGLIVSVSKFRTEVKESLALLLRLFARICHSLRRLESTMSRRLDLPTITFTDALGMKMALPYQLCTMWETFRLMLGVMFVGRPGKSRVDNGQFLIVHAAGGSLLLRKSWNHAVQEGDHLLMSMTLDDIPSQDNLCPFPSCKAPLNDAKVSNGGKICLQCRRWIIPIKPGSPSCSQSHLAHQVFSTSKHKGLEDDLSFLALHEVSKDSENQSAEDFDAEDIELYRNINVGPNITCYGTVSFALLPSLKIP